MYLLCRGKHAAVELVDNSTLVEKDFRCIHDTPKHPRTRTCTCTCTCACTLCSWRHAALLNTRCWRAGGAGRRARHTSCGSARQVAGTAPALDVAAGFCCAVFALAFACHGPVRRRRGGRALVCGRRGCRPHQRPAPHRLLNCGYPSPLFLRLAYVPRPKGGRGWRAGHTDVRPAGASEEGEGDLWERIHFLRHGRGEPPTFAHFVLALRKRTGHVSLVAVLLLDPFLRHYDLRSQQ